MKLTAVPASAEDWSTAGPPDRTAVQIRPVRRITAGGDETNGAFTFLEWAAPAGFGPPAHRHDRGRRGHRAAGPDAPAGIAAAATALTADGWGAVPRPYVVCTQGQPRSATRHLTATS
jgi:hypothetical protein